MAALGPPLPLLLLLLPLPPAAPHCRPSRGPPCSAAPPAPGAHLLGWGLDVTTLRPSPTRPVALGWGGGAGGGAGGGPAPRCRLCLDPHSGGRPLRLPPAVASWRAGRRCRQGARLAVGEGAVAWLVAQGEEVAQGWRAGLGVGAGLGVALAGSRSRVAEFGRQRRREDRYVFASLRLRCGLYWASLSPDARPSPHFLRAVRALPPAFTPATAPDYAELLAAYGTHYVGAAELGGRLRAVTAIRSCRAAMAGLSAREVADCLGVEVTAGGGAGRAGAGAAACRRARGVNGTKGEFNRLFDERLVEVEGGGEHGDLLYGRLEAYTAWMRGLAAAPGLVSAVVRPLHALLPPRHPRRAALREAVGHYITQRATRLGCDAGGRLEGAPCPPAAPCAPSAALTASCCPRRPGWARLRLTAARGEGWRGDTLTATDAYVRAGFGGRWGRTPTRWNDARPRWGEGLDLGWVGVTPGARLRVEVWDEDHGWDDDLLGVCEEPVEAGSERGVVCYPGGGRLDFRYRLTCGPALGGTFCQSYVPQPPQGGGEPPPPPLGRPRGEEGGEGLWGEGEGEEEPTDAFGPHPEELIQLWEGPGGGDPPASGQEGPRDLLDPPSGSKEAPWDLLDPPPNGQEGPRDLLDPPSGSKEAPWDLQDPPPNVQEGLSVVDPPRGSKEAPRDLLDPPPNGQEGPRDLLDPPSGSKEAPWDLLDPPSGSKEAPWDLLDPPSGSKEAPWDLLDPPPNGQEGPQDLLDPPSGSKEAPWDDQDPPARAQEGPWDLLDPPPNGQEGPQDLLDPPSGSKEAPWDDQDPPARAQEAPRDLLDPPSGSKEAPWDLLDPPPNGQEGLSVVDPPRGSKEAPRDLLDPPSGSKEALWDLLDPPPSGQEGPRDLLDPPSGSKEAPWDDQDPPARAQEGPRDLLDPPSGSKEAPWNLLDPPPNSQEAPRDLLDPPSGSKEAP